MALQSRGFQLSALPQAAAIPYTPRPLDFGPLTRSLERMQERKEKKLMLDELKKSPEFQLKQRQASEGLETLDLKDAVEKLNAGEPVGAIQEEYGEDVASQAVLAVENQIATEAAERQARLMELEAKQRQAELDIQKADTEEKRADAYAKSIQLQLDKAKEIEPEFGSEGIRVIDTDMGSIAVDVATNKPISRSFFEEVEEPKGLKPVEGFKDTYTDSEGKLYVKGDDGRAYRTGTFGSDLGATGVIIPGAGTVNESTLPTPKTPVPEMEKEPEGDMIELDFNDLQ